jgi:DNA repair protein RecO (recombination protein O)
MPRLKDQAICLRYRDWSETSQVVWLLTQTRGLVRGLAKGSKRASPGSVARFSGGFEMLTLGQAVATTRATWELASVTEWDLQQTFPHLRRDLAAQQLALYAADLAAHMIADDDPHPHSFAALLTLLHALAETGRAQPALLAFQQTLLTDCGYSLELANDARTSQPLTASRWYLFDPLAGGFTTASDADAQSPAHALTVTGPWKARPQTLDALRRAAAGDLNTLPTDVAERANRLLCVYARYLLDRELPTMRFVLGNPSVGRASRPSR